MKNPNRFSVLKTLLLLALLCLSTKALAHDFEVDNIQYTITSDSTVKVSGQSYWDVSDIFISSYQNYYNISIPKHVAYNDVDYIVSEIGDQAFYCAAYGGADYDCLILIDYDITIPETVTTIGNNAFGGEFGLVNIFFLAETPPSMEDSYNYGHGIINNFVPADSYSLYKETFHDNVFIIGGERSKPPVYKELFLSQPVDSYGPYGCLVNIINNDNSVLFVRENYNNTGLDNHIFMGGWREVQNIESIHYLFESYYGGSCTPDGWMVEFYTVDEGKNPSYTISCGGLLAEKSSPFDFKWRESFDFIDSNIGYGIIDNSIEVTFRGYEYSGCGQKAFIKRKEDINPVNSSISNHVYKSEDDYYELDKIDYYTGNIVIPDIATFHEYKYYENSYYYNHSCYEICTTYPVTSIGEMAFKDCIDLISVVLPQTITTVGEEAFSCCPNLTFIKCLSQVPPSAIDNSFDGGVYQNTTLYVPMSTVEVYRNAPGWRNFQNIVGFNNFDFEVCGIQYSITSENTVEVVGCSDSFCEYNGNYNYYFSLEVEIPKQVLYDNVEYVVTSIADSSFYDSEVIDHVIIPETVTSIGRAAFRSSPGITFVKCLASNPPTLNDSFCGDFILLVGEDAYDDYNSNDEYIQAFNSILCFDGPLSSKPTCEVYPYGGDGICRAFMLVFSNLTEDFEIYGRADYYVAGGSANGWFPWFNIGDSIYIFDSRVYDWSMPHHFLAQAYAVLDSKYYYLLDIDIEDISLAKLYTYDFNDNGIFYDFFSDPRQYSLYVTYEGDVGEKGIYASYVGDVVIPSTVHFAKWDYKVEAIGWDAFYNCVNLNSVTLPSTITTIGYAFENCPNLTFIKCLGQTPPQGDEGIEVFGFDEQNFQNTTLYVPMAAVEAYRNAPGWCEFQNIVGFYDYDFEQDGMYFKKTEDGEVVVTCGENAYSGSVTVPTTVTNQGVTYSVIGIGDGAFANADLTSLYLPAALSTVGSGAFEGCHIQSLYITGPGQWHAGALGITVDNLFICNGVTGIAGLNVNASVIYSYANTPPACDDQTFISYDAELHVPAASLAAYFTALYWCNFLNIIGDAVELQSLAMSQEAAGLLVGGQLSLTAVLTPANATPSEIYWTSSNPAVAAVDGGVVTGLSAGECDIEAVCQNRRALCHVTVTEILPTGITLNQETAKLEVGTQLTLTATILPDDATFNTVTWSTSDSTVATVADGVVTAMAPGVCDVTATCGELEATCHIIVVEHFTYITLDEHDTIVLPNHIILLTPTVTPAETELVVTSSDPAVAAARMANGKVQVVGISEGETLIKVQSADGYAEPDSCWVTVYTEIGDVNCDGFVNVSDVSSIISFLLQGGGDQYSFENADVNHDNSVNLADLSMLIGYLLGGVDLVPKDPVTSIRSFTVNGVTFKMARVRGGTFSMGATVENDSNANANEAPVHDVTLSTYYMGQTEVTQELWLAVMGSNPSNYTGDLQRPVEKVSYDDCQAFITQLNALTGRNFRLPTEAEWEYAARGGNKSHGYMYSGSNAIDEVAWYTANSDGTTHPVATKLPNELGLYDMSGNVCEWCGEWYSLYPEEPQTNPTGPETGRSRIHRGGSLQFLDKNCTVTRRNYFSPGIVRSYMGLRLVMQ